MKRLLALVAVLYVVSVLIPAASFAQSKKEGMRLCFEAYKLHQKTASLDDLRKAVKKYEQAIKILEKVGDKFVVGQAANNLGLVYFRLKEYPKALICYEKALKAWRDVNNPMERNNTVRNLTKLFIAWNKPEKAIEFHEKQLAEAKARNNPTDQINSLRQLCTLYKKLGRRTDVIQCYSRCLKLAQKHNLKKAERDALNRLGIAYLNSRRFDQAIEYLKKSLVVCQGLKDKRGEGANLANLGIVYKNEAQYDKAVPYFEKAVAIFREVKDRRSEAKSLNYLGIVYRNQSQYDKALPYFEKSLAIKRDLKDRRGEANTLTSLGNIYQHWDQNDKAVLYHEKSLAIDRERKDRRGEAKSLLNLGNVYSDWGKYDKAVAYYEKSLEIDRELKNKNGEAKSLVCLGIVYKNWGQYKKALDFYNRGLKIALELKDRKTEGQTLGNLAYLYWVGGQYDKAVHYFRKARAIFRDLKDRKMESNALNNLGVVYKDWGQYDKALSYYKQSLEIDRELKSRRGEATTLGNLGNLYSNWGQYDKAMSYYEKSLAICRELKDPRGEGRALHSLSSVYAHQGNFRKAKETILKVLSIYKDVKLPTKGSQLRLVSLYLDQGDLQRAEPIVKETANSSIRGRFFLLKTEYEKAREEYEGLLRHAEKTRDVSILFAAYTGLGRVFEGIDDSDKAAKYFKLAVALTEDLRTSLTKEQREKFFDVRIDGFLRTAPYEGLARVLMRMNKPTEALKGSEYTKARVFAESMSRLSGGKGFDVPPEVLKEDEQINDKLAAMKNTRQKAYEKQNKLVIESLEPQIKGLEEKRRAHIKMLRDKHPMFAATKYPEPMELSQTAMTDSEWVLSYDVTDSGVIIYLTKGKALIKGLFKQIPRKELDGLVRKFRKPLEIGPGDSTRKKLMSFDLVTGKKLSDILLGGVLSDLPEGVSVVVVADDSLGVLPFEMLVLNEGGKVEKDKKIPYVSGAAFFGDRNPISYYQSITALTLTRTFGKQNKAGTKRLVMDDPVFELEDPRIKRMAKKKRKTMLASLPDKLMSIKSEIGLTFPRLPLTGQLGETLKKLDPAGTDEHTGMKAAKPTLFNNPLDRYGSMVFATHGYFGKDLPGIQEPVLVLTLVGQPSGKDGFLRMSEVMGLKMNADIVALTACQTGLGRRISGEGTMGMGRAFQYAGARSVLMSLWSVAEKSSVMLVESFFKHLKNSKTKLEALRLARKEIREAGYDHPFYWAPFILVGEVD